MKTYQKIIILILALAILVPTAYIFGAGKIKGKADIEARADEPGVKEHIAFTGTGTYTPANYTPTDVTKPVGSAENPFTVLEIVPYQGMASFGYLVDGCEPVSFDTIRAAIPGKTDRELFPASFGSPEDALARDYFFNSEKSVDMRTSSEWQQEGTKAQYGYLVKLSEMTEGQQTAYEAAGSVKWYETAKEIPLATYSNTSGGSPSNPWADWNGDTIHNATVYYPVVAYTDTSPTSVADAYTKWRNTTIPNNAVRLKFVWIDNQTDGNYRGHVHYKPVILSGMNSRYGGYTVASGTSRRATRTLRQAYQWYSTYNYTPSFLAGYYEGKVLGTGQNAKYYLQFNAGGVFNSDRYIAIFVPAADGHYVLEAEANYNFAGSTLSQVTNSEINTEQWYSPDDNYGSNRLYPEGSSTYYSDGDHYAVNAANYPYLYYVPKVEEWVSVGQGNGNYSSSDNGASGVGGSGNTGGNSGNSRTEYTYSKTKPSGTAGTDYIEYGFVPVSIYAEDTTAYAALGLDYHDPGSASQPKYSEVVPYYYKVEAPKPITHLNSFLKDSVGLVYKDNDVQKGRDVETYTFAGWYTDASGYGRYNPDTKVTGNFTLYAKWMNDVDTYYTITYDAATTDTVCNMPLEVTGVLAGTTVKAPSAVPQRDGYKFKHWAVAADGPTNYFASGKSPKINSDVTLHAVWESNSSYSIPDIPVDEGLEYTITFNANRPAGCEASGVDEGTLSDPVKVKRGNKLTLPSTDPKLKGNVEAKIEKFNIRVITVTPEVLNRMNSAKTELYYKELIQYANLIVMSEHIDPVLLKYYQYYGANRTSSPTGSFLSNFRGQTSHLNVTGIAQTNPTITLESKTDESAKLWKYDISFDVALAIYNRVNDDVENCPIIFDYDIYSSALNEDQHGTMLLAFGQRIPFNKNGDRWASNAPQFTYYTNKMLANGDFLTNTNQNNLLSARGNSLNAYKLYLMLEQMPKSVLMSDDEMDAWNDTYKDWIEDDIIYFEENGGDGKTPRDVKSMHTELFQSEEYFGVRTGSTGWALAACADNGSSYTESYRVGAYNKQLAYACRMFRLSGNASDAMKQVNGNHVYWTMYTLLPDGIFDNRTDYTGSTAAEQLMLRNVYLNPAVRAVSGAPQPTQRFYGYIYNANNLYTTGYNTVGRVAAEDGESAFEYYRQIGKPIASGQKMTSAEVMYYLLHLKKQEDENYDDMNRPLTILQVQPTGEANGPKHPLYTGDTTPKTTTYFEDDDFFYNLIKTSVPNWKGTKDDITVVNQPSLTFTFCVDGLADTYDMIYIGTKAAGSIPYYYVPSNTQLAYSHLGDIVSNGDRRIPDNKDISAYCGTLTNGGSAYRLNKTFQTQSNWYGNWYDDNSWGDRTPVNNQTEMVDTIETFAASGNDTSKRKVNELLEFAKTGKPIVFANDFFNPAGSAVNAGRVDTASNYYLLGKTLLTDSEKKTYSYYTMPGSGMYVSGLSKAMNQTWVNLIVYSKPTEYADETAITLATLEKRYPGKHAADFYVNGVDGALKPEYVYIDPTDDSPRNLEFEFEINDGYSASKSVNYEARLVIDLNGDGQFNASLEKITGTEIFDLTDGKAATNKRLKKGHRYKLVKNLDEFEMILPWKLMIVSMDNKEVTDSVSAMSVLRRREEEEKTVIKILQIASVIEDSQAGITTNDWQKNNVYMPTEDDVRKAIANKRNVSWTDAAIQNMTRDQLKQETLTGANFLATRDENRILQYYNGRSDQITDHMAEAMANYWNFSKNLVAFDIRIDRIPVETVYVNNQVIPGLDYYTSDAAKQNHYDTYVYEDENGIEHQEPTRNFISFDKDGNQTNLAANTFMSQYNMVILGFADCFHDFVGVYGDARTVRANTQMALPHFSGAPGVATATYTTKPGTVSKQSLDAIENYIKSGKAFMYTHDTTSVRNTSYSDTREVDVSSDTDAYWGVNMNKRYRDKLGLDRFGVTKSGGTAVLTEYSDEYYADKDMPWKTGTTQTIALANLATANRPSGNRTYYTTNTGDANRRYRVTYQEQNAPAQMLLSQGITNFIFSANVDGGTNDTRTTHAHQINKGRVMSYPYIIDEDIEIAKTHSQYFQINPEDPEVVVWYALSAVNGQSNPYLSATPGDAMNNYYIYGKNNVIYSGCGHDAAESPIEIKLFINTIVASFSISSTVPETVPINDEISSDLSGNRYLHIDYDTSNPTVPIGDGITVQADESGTPHYYKRFEFTLNNKSFIEIESMELEYAQSTLTQTGEKNKVEPILVDSADPEKGYVQVTDPCVTTTPNTLKTHYQNPEDYEEPVNSADPDDTVGAHGGIPELDIDYFIDVPIDELSDKDEISIYVVCRMTYLDADGEPVTVEGGLPLIFVRRAMFDLD